MPAGARSRSRRRRLKRAGRRGRRRATSAIPTSVAALFAEVDERFGRLDVLFNNAGIGAPPVPLEDLTLEQWRAVIETNVTGAFLCTQEAFRHDEAPVSRAAGGSSTTARSRRTSRGRTRRRTRPRSTPITGLTRSTSLDGRAYDIACGQIDIGNAATELTEPMRTTGVLQADGTIEREPTIDVGRRRRAVVYMATLPLDANVQFMTVMATKMPFIGRG